MIMNLLWFNLMYLNKMPVITNNKTEDIITVPDIYCYPDILKFKLIKALPPCKYAIIIVKKATIL